MNRFKKILAFLVVFVMCLQFVPVVKAANSQDVTYTATLDTPTINVSDEDQTVVLTVKTNKAVSMDSMTAYARIPDGLALKSIANEDLGFAAGHYNMNNGKISWYSADGENVSNDLLATITYTVPANTPAGTYEIEFEIELISSDWGTTWENGATVSATLTIVEGTAVEPTYAWTKVTDVDQLSADDLVIIVAADYDYALSTNQKTNNRGQAAVTKNGDIITFADDAGIQILTLEEGNYEGSFAFYTGEGYLYAGSSSKNQLKTEDDLTDNSSWTITIEDGVTTIVAMGDNTRNHMQYNNSSSLFACYGATNTQAAVQIYKRTVVEGGETPTECTHSSATHNEAAPSTCTTKGNIEYWYCADCGKYFSDAGFTTEITKADTELPLADHNFTGADDRICTVCGIYKDGSTLTIDEVLAYGATLASGATTEYKYYVVGTITSVTNTQYGNLYIQDSSTADTLLIYGLYDGETRYDAMETKPVAGDTVEVYGAIKNYNGTIEVIDAQLIEHTVPECEHEDGDDADHNCDKCSYPNVSDHSYAEVREGTWKCACGWYKEESILTIEEAIAFAQLAGSAYSTGKYYVTGTIVEIKSTTYGNMYIEDADGNQLYLYGLYIDEGGTRYDAMTTQPQVGDTITVYGVLGTYNGSSQMKNAWMTEYTPAHKCTLEHVAAKDATCIETGCKEHWYCTDEECGKFYSDADAQNEITDPSTLVIAEDPTNHAGEKNYGSASDISLVPTHHAVICSECGEPWDTENVHEPHEANSDGYCKCGMFAVVIDFNGAKISQKSPDSSMTDEEWAAMVEAYFGGFNATNFVDFSNGMSKLTMNADMFVMEGYSYVGLAYDAAGTQPYNGEQIDNPTTLYMIWKSNHTCSGTLTAGQAASCTEDGWKDYYTCSCGNLYADADCTIQITLDAWKTGDGKIPAGHTSTEVTYENITETTHDVHYACCDALKEANVSHSFNHQTRDFECECGAKYTGWSTTTDGEGTSWTCYVKNGEVLYRWNEVEGDWYYFNTTTGAPVTGLTRVEYPTVSINGITYEANKDALDYDADFIDATEAWFLFDENGKFLATFTGVQEGHYYVNGMQAWHPGAVEDMYFIGDLVNGGNIPANGDTYIIYPNGSSLVEGAIYNFTNGVLSGFDGIVDGKYYEGSRLMFGNGLTKLGENFIYVRSNGQVVMNAEYYVPANDLGVVSGLYMFDENGFMVNPNTNMYNGIVDGKYYINGKVQYGAGLIELDGNFYYVRSNGQVATGTYWITNANTEKTGYEPGKYEFDADGKMLAVKNGIVDGYYYVNNHIQYGAGLIELDGNFYYVRSNGQVATGIYWITNANTDKTGYKPGKYTFDADGKMIVE